MAGLFRNASKTVSKTVKTVAGKSNNTTAAATTNVKKASKAAPTLLNVSGGGKDEYRPNVPKNYQVGNTGTFRPRGSLDLSNIDRA